MDSSIKEEIIRQLDTLPVHIVGSSGIQHVVRCPYCGDSNNPAHGHFSIRIDTSDPLDPMIYRCLKCPVSGILNAQVLEDLQLNVNASTASQLSRLTQASCRVHRITAIKTESFTNPVPSMSELTMKKLNFIEERIGVRLSIEECLSLDIVLNLSDFLVENNLESVYVGERCSPQALWFLNEHYVGFLSKNKNVLTLRYIDDIPPNDLKQTPMRYVKAKIHPKNLDPNSYYHIPNRIDILYTNDINVHIAEGPFDILSILYNRNNRILENNFYYAVCGFGYSSILSNIVRSGINTGINLHIYADKDKTDNEIIRSLNKRALSIWTKRIFIHRNGTGQKDFGVHKEDIIDTCRRIK